MGVTTARLRPRSTSKPLASQRLILPGTAPTHVFVPCNFDRRARCIFKIVIAFAGAKTLQSRQRGKRVSYRALGNPPPTRRAFVIIPVITYGFSAFSIYVYSIAPLRRVALTSYLLHTHRDYTVSVCMQACL